MGKLSGRRVEELFANTRQLDGQGEKRNPADFALWKKATRNISCAGLLRGVTVFRVGTWNVRA